MDKWNMRRKLFLVRKKAEHEEAIKEHKSALNKIEIELEGYK